MPESGHDPVDKYLRQIQHENTESQEDNTGNL